MKGSEDGIYKTRGEAAVSMQTGKASQASDTGEMDSGRARKLNRIGRSSPLQQKGNTEVVLKLDDYGSPLRVDTLVKHLAKEEKERPVRSKILLLARTGSLAF